MSVQHNRRFIEVRIKQGNAYMKERDFFCGKRVKQYYHCVALKTQFLVVYQQQTLRQ